MKGFFCFIFFIFSLGSLAAQSNDMIDEFIKRDFADTGSTLLFITQACGDLPSNATQEEALQWAKNQKWGGSRFSQSESDEIIVSGKFYLALLESFSVKGGLIYSLFKTPRLAAKEAEYQGISTGVPFVNHPMTPQEVFTSLSSVTNMMESTK